MTRSVNRFASLAVVILLASPAVVSAQEAGDSRFTMSPTEGGFVRLDTQTGEMAFCQRENRQWTCAPMEDVAARTREELRELRRKNRALRDEIARLDQQLGKDPDRPDQLPPRADRGPVPGLNLPSEAEVDRALDYFGNILKKFKDQIRKLEESPAETSPAPEQSPSPETEADPEPEPRAL